MKKFEIPVKSKKMALQAGGFAQGIHFIIELVRAGEAVYPTPQGRIALKSLADSLERDFEAIIREFVKNNEAKEDRGNGVVWN